MKKLIATLGLALGGLLCGAPASADIKVTFAPSSQHINIGDVAVVDVSISGLGSEILAGFDLNFRYDPAILNWRVINGSSVYNQMGPAWGGFAPLFSFDTLVEGDLGTQGGSLELDADVAANQANSFLLFSFQLDGMADGFTTFGLGSDPDFERNFVGLDALSLQVDVGSACIAVGTGQCQTVPEPSSLLLLAIALAGLSLPAVMRRREDKSRQ